MMAGHLRTKKRFFIVSALLLLAGCMQEQAVTIEPDTGRFNALLEEHWHNTQRENIVFRGDSDAWRMDGTLSEHTPEARERRRAFNDGVLARLEQIDPDQLSPEDRTSYELFQYERRTERDSYRQFDHFFPFTSLGGYHTQFAKAPANMPFLDGEDYEDYLISLNDFPRFNNEHIANMREAIVFA